MCQASSFAVAGQLSCLTDVQLGSALTRFYRFLLTGQYFVLDGGGGQEPVPPGDY